MVMVNGAATMAESKATLKASSVFQIPVGVALAADAVAICFDAETKKAVVAIANERDERRCTIVRQALRMPVAFQAQPLPQIHQAQDEAYGLPVPDARALAKVQPGVARRNLALPLRIDQDASGSILAIVTPDPSHEGRLADVQRAARMRVRAEAMPAEIVRPLLRRWYRLDELQERARLNEAATRSKVSTDDLIGKVLDRGGTELHYEPYLLDNELRGLARCRVDGMMHFLLWIELDEYMRIIRAVKTDANMTEITAGDSIEGRMTIHLGHRTVDARLEAAPTVHRSPKDKSELLEQLVIRVIDRDQRPLTLEETGLMDPILSVYRLILRRVQGGGIIVCGPPESGKTMFVLATLLSEIDLEHAKVNSIEHPAELIAPGINQMSVERDMTYKRAKETFVRLSTTHAFAGEMRDDDSKEIMELGHIGVRLWTTFHEDGVMLAPIRLIQMGHTPLMVASTVRAFVGMRLIRRLCSVCKVPDTAQWAEVTTTRKGATLFTAPQHDDGRVGCDVCAFTGYAGRIGVFEILPVTTAVKNVIIELGRSTSLDDLRRAGEAVGFRPMMEDAYDKVALGITSVDEVHRGVPWADDDAEIAKLLATFKATGTEAHA